MDNPYFSVILPVHNAEGYFMAMLESIRKQTFTDYELIVICDRCSDDSAEIAKAYTDIVREVDFGKAGLARNVGLDLARGEWILFADDDDWFLHEYVFENIADTLKERGEGKDLMAFGFIWKMGNRNVITPALHDDKIWIAPWTKAWRRSFIGDHRFPAWKHSDDLGFAEEMYPLIRNYGTSDQAIYYYNYMHEGSTQWRLKNGELSNDDMRE